MSNTEPVVDAEAVAKTEVGVTCASCGHTATIMFDDSTKDANGVFPSVTWKCNCAAGVSSDPNCKCDALNVTEGHAGEPGEAALNPAASALTDEQLEEAYNRRIVPLKLEGGANAAGATGAAKETN